MRARRFVPAMSIIPLLLSVPGHPVDAANPNWPDTIADDADLSDPANMPDDPGYYRVDGEGQVHGQWNLWSFMPQAWIDTGDPIRPEELTLGPGMHADRAWLLTTGRRDVVIAVLDSGARWNNRDLVNKYYLNAGELDRDGARPCVPSEFGGDPLDVDGNGFFNIEDYAVHADQCDFDIDAEGNANGLIDPQDLILSDRYADGVDDDENGYTDDISGWDFFWNDNDAHDDTHYGHGNGEAEDSGSEGNNGMGDIGVCPECTLLMVRAGDSFVVDANDFADGVVFAVDSGAAVIQEALGAINNTTFSRQAIEYAYDNNVVVIASAADELSFHHNLPGTNNHTVYVHAVVHDRENRARATTFLNYNNCTNHGAQLLLSTPGTGCSSEATGKSAGHAGLIVSYARDLTLDPPLSSEEVRGLMVMSVDDIDVPESNPGHPDYDDTKFPSGPGWDIYFGYGRNNVRRSLELIRDDRIVPEVDIVSPAWFETIYPEGEDAIFDLVGRIGARVDGLGPRYDSYDYVVEVAQGAEPQDGEYRTLAEGTTDGIDGVLATADVADFSYTGIPQSPHHFAVTVRLRACVTGSGAFGDGGICGEFRKAFFVHTDPDLHEGFPVNLGASGEASGAFVDLDGDGADELIMPTADGIVHALMADGSEADGWPVFLDARNGHRDDSTNDHAGACSYRRADDRGDCPTRGHVDYVVRYTSGVGSPAVADLDGDDGEVEIVVTSFDGFVYAFHRDGSRVAGFPVRTDPALSAHTDENNIWDEGIAGAPVVYDLDGDGDLEIITGAMDQRVYVWHHDGSLADGFPVYCRDFARDGDPNLSDSVGARIFATPAVGDLDADGDPEIIVGSNEVYDSVESRVYIIHWDGNEHDNGPFEWVDPDAEAPGPLRNFSLLGEVLPVVGRGLPSAATLADIDFDGYIEFAVEGVGGQPTMRRWDGETVSDLVYADTSTAGFGPGSDVEDDFSYTLISHGAFAYLDDSGDLAYLKSAAGIDFALAFAAGGQAATFDHQLGAWNTRTGRTIYGFPRVMEDWQFYTSPTVVDLDNDGYPEVVNGSGGYLLRAFNWEGAELAGWPKHTGGWIVSSAAVGDFDGDGFWDVSVMTRAGWLFVWRTQGTVDSILEWNGFGHDNQNTFNYETPLPGRDRVIPTGDDDGAEVVDVVEPGPDAGDAPVGDGAGDVSGDDPAAPPATGSDSGCCATTGSPGGGDTLVLALLVAGLFRSGRRRRAR